MKKYLIDFERTTRSGEENLLIIEAERVRFTKREFDIVMSWLFEFAGEGIENKELTAYVSCDMEPVLTVKFHTEEDGPDITAYAYAARPLEKYQLLRKMKIAC